MGGTAPSPYLQYFDRLMSLDRRGAMSLVDEFLTERGGDVEALYTEVLMPALVHAGAEWEANRISVAHEHYISEVTRDLIFRNGPRLWGAVTPGENAPVAVTCAAPDERHVLGLMMVGDILRASGFVVHSLGEGAPADAVARFVAQLRADVMGVTIGLPEHLEQASRMIAAARKARPGLIVLAGGHAMRAGGAAVSQLGSDYHAADVRALRQLLPEIATRLRHA